MSLPLLIVRSPESSCFDVVDLITWLLSTVLRVVKVLMKSINSMHRSLLELLITWVACLLHHWHIVGHLVIHVRLLRVEVGVLLVDIITNLGHGSLLVVER